MYLKINKLCYLMMLSILILAVVRVDIDKRVFGHGQTVDTETATGNQESAGVSPATYLPAIYDNFNPNIAPPGLINSTIIDVPGNDPLSCEHSYTTRMTMDNLARGIHPQSMHFSACNIGSNAPTMFASFTLAQTDPNEPDEPFNNQSGMIMQTILDPTSNTLNVVQERHFPECEEMIGIDTSNSCNIVAALCRTDSGRTDYDKDIVATHPNPDNWLKDEGQDEMWLYEWTNGDIQSEPAKYIVHQGIGGWEYGQYSLVYGENDNTYGIALKSTRGGHEADSFTVVDRDTYTLDASRGWDWSCGTGHTIYNRPSYNPSTQEYGLLCGTDYNNLGAGRYGSISFTTETTENPNFLLLQRHRTQMKGGPGPLHPLADGGWIGIVVGIPDVLSYGDDDGAIRAMPPTEIGLARFDQAGNLAGNVNWIVSASPYYVSYPQLVPLENGNYLLGYGKMPANASWFDYHFELRWLLFFPQEYWVQEIDANGQTVGRAWLLEDVAWGELDQMVPLGNNKIGWATYYMDRLTGTPDDGRYYQPECNANQIQFNVYNSPNP
ncbi:MAG: hypothetical protein AAF490_15960 [Chloroflexota bacterium]